MSVAAAVTVAVAITSFILSWTLAVREPIAIVTSAQVADPPLINGTLSSRQVPMQVTGAIAVGAAGRITRKCRGIPDIKRGLAEAGVRKSGRAWRLSRR